MTRKNKGFTLIELMVTISVVAIISAIAVPSFRDMVLENRLVAFSNDFTNTIALARNEALSRRSSVTISPVGAHWDSGWTVVSGGEQVGKVEALEQLTATGTASDIVMSSKGVLTGLAWGAVKVCDKRPKCRTLTLTGAGVVSVTKS